jgi:hypothetical protein
MNIMARIVSLNFEHEGNAHYCIIKIEKKDDLTMYTFRLKTEELQELLSEDNYFVEKDGQIQVSVSSEDLKRSKLKLAIAHAIADYFKVHQETL